DFRWPPDSAYPLLHHVWSRDWFGSASDVPASALAFPVAGNLSSFHWLRAAICLCAGDYFLDPVSSRTVAYHSAENGGPLPDIGCTACIYFLESRRPELRFCRFVHAGCHHS